SATSTLCSARPIASSRKCSRPSIRSGESAASRFSRAISLPDPRFDMVRTMEPVTVHARARLRRTAVRIALAALGFRVASAVMAFLANVAFPMYERQPSILGVAGAGSSTFWDTFTRFDSGWYYPIARNGYQYLA